jgi:CRISPR/Cas system-associated exonuclease Cas4 (RecB family)
MKTQANTKSHELPGPERSRGGQTRNGDPLPLYARSRVSATDLRRLIECPLACWYAAQEPFETAAPTLGLAIGEVVHVCRAELSRSAWQRYVTAKSPGELWSQTIEAQSRDQIASNFDRHAFLSAFGSRAAAARLSYTTLLLAMERQRALRASDILARGITGCNLASRVLPFEVEVPVYDEAHDLAGICDEVWKDGKFVIPVELKTSPPTREHKLANRAQAATYGFLFTVASGLKVRECRVHYITQGVVDSFRFDGAWKRRVSRLVDDVRSNRSAPVPPKGKPSPAICGYCSFQAVCPESRAPSLAQSLDYLFSPEVAA